jgi:predicted membrane chloride channel (bestrophin family)
LGKLFRHISDIKEGFLLQYSRWKMVPVVTVVAITLMGIEGIADEIEMPFGEY